VSAQTGGVEARLRRLAGDRRAILFAGLPGTGKSFLAHRAAEFAHAAGRPVHLLQWDVVRPVFEATPAGRRYPMRDGITQPIIRRAAGIWARAAVARWDAAQPRDAVLIGECPLVGHRFIELARPAADDAEALLAGARCVFAVPVPSVEIRRALEADRNRRSLEWRHEREREDALPAVLRALWDDVAEAARRLGISERRADPSFPYDPDVYAKVYRRVLGRRGACVLAIDRLMSSSACSVYAFSFPTNDVMPTSAEADEQIKTVEAAYPDPAALDREVARWYAP